MTTEEKITLALQYIAAAEGYVNADNATRLMNGLPALPPEQRFALTRNELSKAREILEGMV